MRSIIDPFSFMVMNYFVLQNLKTEFLAEEREFKKKVIKEVCLANLFITPSSVPGRFRLEEILFKSDRK